MKCPGCAREVALAQTCPYCGKPVAQAASSEGEALQRKTQSASRGTFRGQIGPMRDKSGERVYHLLPDAWRYFRDPAVAGWRKTLILLGILYVVSPLDLVPGAMLPLLGWLDDAVVATFAWKLLASELERYRRLHM